MNMKKYILGGIIIIVLSIVIFSYTINSQEVETQALMAIEEVEVIEQVKVEDVEQLEVKINELQNKVISLTNDIESLQNQTTEQNKKYISLQSKLEEQNNKILSLTDNLNSIDIEKIENSILKQNEIITNTTKQVTELEKIHKNNLIGTWKGKRYSNRDLEDVQITFYEDLTGNYQFVNQNIDFKYELNNNNFVINNWYYIYVLIDENTIRIYSVANGNMFELVR